MFKSFAIVGVFTLLYLPPAQACTVFALDGDKKIIVAKVYQIYLTFGHGAVHVYPRGIPRTSLVLDTAQVSVRWISKYGSVSLTHYGRGTAVSGMNEKGLVVEPVRDPKGDFGSDHGLAYVNEGEWTQFQLDNFATVAEVVAGLPQLKVKPIFLNLHFIVFDRSGDRAVISFRNGEPRVYQNQNLPLAAITAMPYEIFIERSHRESRGDDGDLDLLTKTCRKLEAMVKLGRTYADSALISYALLTLESYSQKQAVLFRPGRNQAECNLIYDVRDRELHFRTAQSYGLKHLNLNELDFSEGAAELMTNINHPVSDDFRPHIGPYDPTLNAALLEK